MTEEAKEQPKKKRGRKTKEVSQDLMRTYASFRVWQILVSSNDQRVLEKASRWSKENGYAGFTDKAFCDKHNIERNYTVEVKKNPAFKSLYYNQSLNLEYENLPVALNLLLRKMPDKWLQNVFPEETAQRTIQKVEVDTTERRLNLEHLSFEELYMLRYGKKPE